MMGISGVKRFRYELFGGTEIVDVDIDESLLSDLDETMRARGYRRISIQEPKGLWARIKAWWNRR